MDFQDDELMKPGEIGTILRVNPKTVTRWFKAGKVRGIRTPGGHIRVFAVDVAAMLHPNTSSDETEGDKVDA